jgi:hypothetical protein
MGWDSWCGVPSRVPYQPTASGLSARLGFAAALAGLVIRRGTRTQGRINFSGAKFVPRAK